MDDTQKNPELIPDQAELQEKYEPRPLWQVWGARIGLVIFIVFVILQILGIARGGL